MNKKRCYVSSVATDRDGYDYLDIEVGVPIDGKHDVIQLLVTDSPYALSEALKIIAGHIDNALKKRDDGIGQGDSKETSEN